MMDKYIKRGSKISPRKGRFFIDNIFSPDIISVVKKIRESKGAKMRKATEVAQDKQKVTEKARGDEQLGTHLRDLRENSELSVNQVSRETDIAVQSLQKYEKAEGLPNIRGLATLASFYDVTLDDLAGHLIR